MSRPFYPYAPLTEDLLDRHQAESASHLMLMPEAAFTNPYAPQVVQEETDAERHARQLAEVERFDRVVMGNLFLAGVCIAIASVVGWSLWKVFS